MTWKPEHTNERPMLRLSHGKSYRVAPDSSELFSDVHIPVRIAEQICKGELDKVGEYIDSRIKFNLPMSLLFDERTPALTIGYPAMFSEATAIKFAELLFKKAEQLRFKNLLR
ncbi:hypothetical protein [Pseudomonas sp.]|uniref:hypothetical protein n=1 Tax=Pseudomonas sp. TaxID=306 RepID=UPI0026046D46|nr:hypothetical protein [Pseudomonas sp.]